MSAQPVEADTTTLVSALMDLVVTMSDDERARMFADWRKTQDALGLLVIDAWENAPVDIAPPSPALVSAPRVTIHVGDCRDVLKTLPAQSVHCVV